MMRAWADSVYFTRQQISALAGVQDGILTFWIKNGLLIPSRGGHGRGSHRKFAPIQVTFAAILGSLQQFGLNISSLGAFASILQRGAEICEGVDLHPYSLMRAARFACKTASVKRGETVSVYDYKNQNADRTCPVIEAASESEIEAELLGEMMEHDPGELILEFAKTLSDDDYEPIEIYHDIKLEMDALDIADFGWLLWQDEAGNWKVASQTEPNEDFGRYPDVETGIFLAVGRIIRRVWGLSLEERVLARRVRWRAELKKRNPELAARFE